jgi:uncharacterized protein
MFMMYLDLDELPTLFDRFLLWSKDKTNFASFKTKNYLVAEASDNNSDSDSDSDSHNNRIKNGVRNEIEQQRGVIHKGPIRMLTHLSYFGYCFNPVTFYYCFDESDERVDFIVAQINNTPWGERYCYVIDNKNAINKSTTNGKAQKKSVESHFDKAFHVSPFLPMDMQYSWRFSEPAEKLSVYMKNTQENEKFFDVSLNLKAKPITSVNLAKALIKFPLMTLQVIFKIYWQSLVLWLKKVPFYESPSTSKKIETSNLAE